MTKTPLQALKGRKVMDRITREELRALPAPGAAHLVEAGPAFEDSRANAPAAAGRSA